MSGERDGRPAAGEWAGAVDPRLAARLLRRATHPGVISRAPAAVTYARTQRMASRLPMLDAVAARSAVAPGTASPMPVVSALPLALPALPEDAAPSISAAGDAGTSSAAVPLVQRSAAPSASPVVNRVSTTEMRTAPSPSADAARFANGSVAGDAGLSSAPASPELPVVTPVVRGVPASSAAGMIHRSPALPADTASASTAAEAARPAVSGDAQPPLVVHAQASGGEVQRAAATLAKPASASETTPAATVQGSIETAARSVDTGTSGDAVRSADAVPVTRAVGGPEMPLMRQRRRTAEDSASAPIVHHAPGLAPESGNLARRHASPESTPAAASAAGSASASGSGGMMPSIQRAAEEPVRGGAESASADSPMPVVAAVASASSRDGGFGGGGSVGEMIHRAPAIAVTRAADGAGAASAESRAGAASPVVSAVPAVQRRAEGASGASGGPRLVVAEARPAASSRAPAAAMVQRAAVRAEAPARVHAPAALVHAPPRAWTGESAGGFASPVQRMSAAAPAVQRQASPEPAPAPAAEMPTRTAAPPSAPDVSGIAAQVYDILAARLASERRQRGL